MSFERSKNEKRGSKNHVQASLANGETQLLKNVAKHYLCSRWYSLDAKPLCGPRLSFEDSLIENDLKMACFSCFEKLFWKKLFWKYLCLLMLVHSMFLLRPSILSVYVSVLNWFATMTWCRLRLQAWDSLWVLAERIYSLSGRHIRHGSLIVTLTLTDYFVVR